MSTEENKALVRRAIEEVWNQGHVALIDELDHANLIHHDPDFPNVRTREDYRQWVHTPVRLEEERRARR